MKTFRVAGGTASCQVSWVPSASPPKLAVLIVAGLVFAACGSADAGARANASGRVTVDSLPNLTIAGTGPDGSTQLANPGTATRLSDGTIVVTDYADKVLRYFRDGELIRIVGREGSGPGEFRSPVGVHQCNQDSLFVLDPLLRRVSVFDSAGRYVRELKLSRRPAALECSRDGVIAILPMPENLRAPDPANGLSPQYRVPLVLLNTAGDTLRVTGEVPLGETRPLGRVTRIALGRDRVYVGTADTSAVTVLSYRGDSIGILPLGDPPRAPTTEDYNRAVESMIAGMAASYQPVLRKQLLDVPMPDRVPPYRGLYADPTGTLWGLVSAPGEPHVRLQAIDGYGRLVGEATLPGGLQVYEIGRDYLLGELESESGERHVVVYRVNRG